MIKLLILKLTVKAGKTILIIKTESLVFIIVTIAHMWGQGFKQATKYYILGCQVEDFNLAEENKVHHMNEGCKPYLGFKVSYKFGVELLWESKQLQNI